jgi:hypothetical protein
MKPNPQMWNEQGPNNRVAHAATCRAIAMQRPRNGRIYQGSFWATVR